MAQIPLPLYITRAGQLWQHKEHMNSENYTMDDPVDIRKFTVFKGLLLLVQ